MRTLPLVCLLACLLVGAAHAQEAVDLRYKFTAGETDTYQITTGGTIPLDLTPGPEAGIPPMTMDLALNMVMQMTQACTGVDDKGVGQLEMCYPTMTVQTKMQAGEPIDMLMKWENGALTTTLNGQAQPVDENQKKMMALLASVMKMKMTPQGKTTLDPETEKIVQAMMSASGGMQMDFGKLNALTNALPDHPVKVGDTWTLEDSGQMGAATLTGTSTFKLAALEPFEGVPTARIEGEARMSINGQMPTATPVGMPVQTNITRLDIALAFVNHFDPARGKMLASDMNMNQNMAMMISMGAPGGQMVHLPATIENAQMSVEFRHK